LNKKGAKFLRQTENLNKLFSVTDGKFKLPAQERYLAPFNGNGSTSKCLLRFSYLTFNQNLFMAIDHKALSSAKSLNLCLHTYVFN
jgi:hypothetical protein